MALLLSGNLSLLLPHCRKSCPFRPFSDPFIQNIVNTHSVNASLDEHSLFDKFGKVTTRFPFLDVCNFLISGVGNPPVLLHKPDGLLLAFRKSQARHNRICQPILAFVDARLAAKPEESDVVHDLLAFLAEQMVEMNKAKNVEIKAFLNFVESEIGVSVDSLSNKTLIQEYYTNDFTKFIDALVKNKNRIKEGYNPKSPTNRKLLHEWYDQSVAKLNPLMAKIDATDTLIDQIVYRMYGLTEDEIKIVEGAPSS